MTKEKKINEELKRLRTIFKDMPELEFNLIQPLFQNAAFMKVTLDELQEIINEEGCVDNYQNGANQSGIKQSATLQAYNNTFKNYQSVMVKLKEKVPESRKKSKLEQLMDE